MKRSHTPEDVEKIQSGWRKRQIQMQITMEDDDIQDYVRPCNICEYNKQRAQLWRDEAYKHAGHPLPEREWVGLTNDEEIFAVSNTMPYANRFEFARAIEAKLKEKNNGKAE
jgi:hypothetical protein